MGDIFDYWFEYSTVIPKLFFRTLTALDEFRKQDIPVHYIMGNHDFGHQTFFREHLDIEISKDDISVEWEGKKFYLSHGDGKQYNDTGYKILKKILRNKLSQSLFKFIHPDIGIGIATHASHSSRVHGDKKESSVVQRPDGQRDFAFERINEGYDYVIMGHRHKPELTAHNKGFYVNTGDMLHHKTFAYFIDGTMHLVTTDEFYANISTFQNLQHRGKY
jgi:UDP-2,3-diacylglucosamine hydrolase